MEKRVKIYLGIGAILILISLLPIIEAYQLHHNRQQAYKERLLTELIIDEHNINEVNADDNINVDMISVEHIFTDDKGKEIVAHSLKDYQQLMKTSQTYRRTYQLDDQSIQIIEQIAKKRVKEIYINKDKINVDIKTREDINHHYIKTPIIFEKKISTGETLLMVFNQNKNVIQYVAIQSHAKNINGKTTLETINLDGVWNNRLNLVGFKILPEQHISHYIFYLFIFYPLLTLILGIFLCYICYLRVKMKRAERKRQL